MKKTNQFQKSSFLAIFLLCISIFLIGCSNPLSTLSSDDMQSTVQSLVKTQIAATVEATTISIEIVPTQTPHQQEKIFLLVGTQESNQTISNHIAVKLNEMATQEQGIFQHISLANSQLNQEVKIAVFLSPAENPIIFADAHPNTQIIAIDYQNLETRNNLASIVLKISSTEASFAAGILASMVSENWAIAILSLENEEMDKQATFIQGAKAFCGSCKISEDQDLEFPLAYSLPAISDPVSLQNAINQMRWSGVDIVYLTSGIQSTEIENSLSQNGFKIAVENSSNSSTLNWIFSISNEMNYDFIDKILSQPRGVLTAGEFGGGISFSNYDSAIVSQGKLNKLNEILENLQTGFFIIH